MNAYIQWVVQNPLLSAAIQFACLGTLGELISCWIQKGRIHSPFGLCRLGAKILAWALLGVIIKYGFVGMKGFTIALLDHELLPQCLASGVGWAFALSVFTNLFFGPQMMFFHRLEDNLIMGDWNLKGLHRALWTLLWFWIPAHTLTFSLPKEYQIGLAALWSVVLGVIMGLAKKRG